MDARLQAEGARSGPPVSGADLLLKARRALELWVSVAVYKQRKFAFDLWAEDSGM